MSGDISRKRCFVVGPIGDPASDIRVHADWLYEGIIRQSMNAFSDFDEPVRADKISQPGMITTQIIELLLEADLVIADLSYANPNVFYEIGIRHMVQKPIIHMQLIGEKEPFDVSGYRAIRYSLKHPSDLTVAQQELLRAVKVAIATEYKVENPVTHARGRLQIEQSASPEQRVLLEEIRALQERVSLVEGRAKRTKTRRPEFFAAFRNGTKFESLHTSIGLLMKEHRIDTWSATLDDDGDIRLRIDKPLTEDEIATIESGLSDIGEVTMAAAFP